MHLHFSWMCWSCTCCTCVFTKFYFDVWFCCLFVFGNGERRRERCVSDGIWIYIYIYTTELWLRVLIFSGVKVSGIYYIVAWKARLFHIHTFVWNPCLETQLRDGSVQQSWERNLYSCATSVSLASRGFVCLQPLVAVTFVCLYTGLSNLCLLALTFGCVPACAHSVS